VGRDPLDDPAGLIGSVYGYVAYRLGDGPDAEDVTSDTIERAVRYRSSYKRKDGEPIQWLIGIARRCIADHLKRAGRTAPDDAIDDWASDRTEPVAARLDLRRALHVLDERERELVALRYGADLSARQIADLLFLRTNTVEVALHRALGKLRAELDESKEAPGAPEHPLAGEG
jgi:RNA polymerase sigma-70 factor, ECF subfamily